VNRTANQRNKLRSPPFSIHQSHDTDTNIRNGFRSVDASILPLLRQADRRRHLLLGILQAGRLREDLLLANFEHDLLLQHPLLALLDPTVQQVLPHARLRLQLAPTLWAYTPSPVLPLPEDAVVVFKPTPQDFDTVEFPQQPLLDAEPELERLRSTHFRAFQEGTPGLRCLVRAGQAPTATIHIS
jgi:hypothetical protein